MIAYLRGTIQSISEQHLVLLVGQVGYKVFVTPAVLGEAEGGDEVALHTHQYVREDALELYGFARPEELRIFELLISVSGIGPKTALGILSVTTPEQLRAAVVSGNVGILTKVSGIGKKTAERLLVELKDTFTAEAKRRGSSAETLYEGDVEVIEALERLGYGVTEARQALELVPQETTDTEQRLKAVLKKLGGKR
jgi:Holliday junction DNA helicase RuvA